MAFLHFWTGRLLLFFTCLVLFLPAQAGEQARSREEVVSAYIFLVSKNTTWPGKIGPDEFRIMVLEKGQGVSTTLAGMTRDMRLKGYPIRVLHASSAKKLAEQPDFQVLYVGRSFAKRLGEIHQLLPPSSPVLVISEDAPKGDDIMVNLYHDLHNRIHLRINRGNITASGLSVSEKILLTGGDEIGVSKLFDASIAALKEQEARFQHYAQLNEQLKKEAEQSRSRIGALKTEIASKNQELKQLEKRLDARTREVKDTSQRLEQQKRVLTEREQEVEQKARELTALGKEFERLRKNVRQQQETLNKRSEELQTQQQEIRSRNAILKQQQQNIRDLDTKIREQQQLIQRHEEVMHLQSSEIERQLTSIYFLVVLVILLILLSVYSYRSKHRAERLTLELARAKEAAEYANRSKSAFLANMSHELRTPLNAILGFSELLVREPAIPEKHRETLAIVHRSGNFLLTLINEVLDLARVESGKVTIDERPVIIQDIVGDVMSLMEERARMRGLQLELETDASMPSCLITDGDKLRQILLNYLSNAIKYSDRGKVILRLKTDGDRLRIEVEDQGVGISEADIQRIFEPFVQVGSASEQTGTGLGLAITRQFVRAMGGDTGVDSTPGEGSVFSAWIKCRICSQDEEQMMGQEPVSDVIGLADAQQPVRILMVEDKQDNRLLLRSILNIPGLEVREAQNGREAVEMFQHWRPDFIWMDRRMPLMNGEEATRRIRQLPGGDKVVIVALTASAFASDRERIMASGMDDFLVKPYPAHAIFEMMKKHLGLKYRYQDHPQEQDEDAGREVSVQELREHLEALPEALQEALGRAAILLSKEDMAPVIEKIAHEDGALADILRHLVDNMRYQDILEVLQQLRESR
ncbi:YfiR/HmsC family protein [Thiolapillus brandeum]|uniref:YfiR/HmsC family protein n=1 Tax=Thiolapillus brandeum TaxID=1076588 RepID=UPI00118691E9|nr:YfiR/HmsC family protein [Thiolapillus brandeum]